MEEDQGERRKRGEGRGSQFFAIGRDVWADLWSLPTANRMHFVMTYLVLLAGTGSDHRLTKWSAKAVEDHTGIGKPRAKRAIEELIEAGLIERTESSTKLAPQYRLPELPLDEEPIFLPLQIITGLVAETPILRRVRETGSALALRMLVDLYGLVQVDATYGIPIGRLRQAPNDGETSGRKMCEIGATAVWALTKGNMRWVEGDWTKPFRTTGKDEKGRWAPFWETLDLLLKIGAVWWEPWVFDGEALDAEPVMPVDPAVLYGVEPKDDEARLTRLAMTVATSLVGDRDYLFDRYAAEVYVPMTQHHQTPALRGVLRMRVEPDALGRRIAWARRNELIEKATESLTALQAGIDQDRYDQPMRTISGGR